MQTILILGAGRSATSLINYLLLKSGDHNYQVVVADRDLPLVKKKLADHPNGKAVSFEIEKEQVLNELIGSSDLVISMLPARFHDNVARACIRIKKNMLTASYVSEELKSMEKEVEDAGIMFLMECGLDPGIDHMSAMREIDKIRANGNELTHFETFTGGLLAPQSELHNPWKYKFTWNPRNVVLAGQGTVKFIQEGRYKYIPYRKLFRRTEIVEIPGYGFFEGYANRDSLKYLDVYGLKNIKTLYRGTFRRPGFCKAWDVFIQLGATDDTYELENVAEMTHRQFINSFLSFNPDDSIELKLAHYLNLELNSEIMFKLKWLGMFKEEKIGLDNGTPAQILEHILKKKWSMGPDDKDLIVMWHKFVYKSNGRSKEANVYTVVQGENSEETAMAKTVGLPLGTAATLMLNGSILKRGIHVPIDSDIYTPILEELESAGITFIEQLKD
jgi:saccharopine dehydrogenase-like NADP-dependent oxidoreductase